MFGVYCDFVRMCITFICGICMGTVIYIYTSSTAQSGGGSFKNRKPIGEVGCCESTDGPKGA